jgi:small subunit ribosomal protein S1
MERDKKGQLKISLSMKQVTEDPWQSITEKYKAGDKVTGKVTKNMDFGSFVEIEPGVEGLVHISELSYTKRITKPEEVVSVGDTVSVMIKEIDPEKKRIALSLRDAAGDPWLEVPQKYKAGQVVSAIVEKVERFGVFIQLEPGITGLLPQSKLSKCNDTSFKSKMQEGNTVQVKIEEMQPEERRITLEPAASEETDDWKQFSGKKEKAVTNLGDKLQEAIHKKSK